MQKKEKWESGLVKEPFSNFYILYKAIQSFIVKF